MSATVINANSAPKCLTYTMYEVAKECYCRKYALNLNGIPRFVIPSPMGERLSVVLFGEFQAFVVLKKPPHSMAYFR